MCSVFGTDFGQPGGWLATPRAVQRVLLRARAAGVWSSGMDQPIEVGDLRSRLAETIAQRDAYPQLLLRFGHGPPVRPEPRRAVDKVLVEEAS